ncbi:MAG TPA: ATP-binding protein [Chryseolinea sp.]|nr:ATP-binding protein [Chryseolinea sp.]
MKNIFLVMSFLLLANSMPAQVMRTYNEDSLRAILDNSLEDTTRIDVYLKLAGSYFFKQPDSCLMYANAALESSRRLNYYNGIFSGLTRSGEAMRQMGNFTGALKNQFEALEISQKIKKDWLTMILIPEANSTGFIGMNYVELKDYERAFDYLKKAIALRKGARADGVDLLFRLFIARAYNENSQTDSAFYFLKEARMVYRTPGPQLQVFLTYSLGDAFLQAKNIDSANFYYRLALNTAYKYPKVLPNHISMTSYKLASVLNTQNKIDSSFYFARLAFRIAREKSLNPRILDASSFLAQLHRQTGKLDSALFYQDIANASNEAMYGKEKFIALQLLLSQEQRRIQEDQRAEERYQNTILLIGLVSITTVILIASILLFRSNRIKQKTNLALQKTLTELKSTQSQLIQAEKMASLGELTAGIAHEIQNPLNFVNNFSEVNAELIDDLKKELASGNRKLADEIADSIKENQEKINHHGKRADGIVKSMLQHSRSSSGLAEPTDINALCDEYIRLTYHGYRAKDKSFSAKFNTNFDPTVPMVNVVPQDIGRVILNLINNAFHAVSEKSAFTKATADEKYEPMVTMNTKRLKGYVEIRVQDNGPGIPDAIKEKIFQPFFTTKPTGQGTGLGLSLSYDIIKAHGGTLEVSSSQGVGSEFIILLPFKAE